MANHQTINSSQLRNSQNVPRPIELPLQNPPRRSTVIAQQSGQFNLIEEVIFEGDERWR
ncbi:13214_t:CDS:2 [Acaulospora colombiana]|uniref:13214_t:CDS:1 n=1 Tax=Acaulospora colombiana TaxID=27376 RepID=A0ACA9L4V9_9GLOM|nr:13214_t:CDS:2 [Acaulospora colombiana]